MGEIMIYTQDEKTKMDILLEAFRSYVDSREDYDVLWSPKAGFLRVIIGESSDQVYFLIAGFADMMRMFTDDFLADEEERVGHYLKRDYDRVRSLLAPRLDALEAYREEAYGIMEETFEACRLRSEHFRQDRLAEIRRLEELIGHLRGTGI